MGNPRVPTPSFCSNPARKEVIKVSLSLYKVEWTPLHYPGSLGDQDSDFLDDFQNEQDETYYIDEDSLDKTVLAWDECGKREEIPDELVQFLREKVKEAEEGNISLALL